MQKQEINQWFDAFNESFGLSVENSPSLQLLKELPEKEFKGQEKVVTKPKFFKRWLARFRRSKLEPFVSQEDAEEVISCCLCAMEVMYGIHLNTPYSVKVSHTCKDGTVLDIKNMPELNADEKRRKRQLKWVKKRQKKEGMIIVLRSAPYISVAVAFLEKYIEAKVSKAKALEIEEKKDRERETQWNKRKPHITVWLTANCLYNMGELEYAKKYVRDHQKGENTEVFDGICSEWGIPWDVEGKKMNQLLRLLDR